MMRWLLWTLVLWWGMSPLHAAEPERVALLPVSSLGMPEVQTQVLFNQLQERLSLQFSLVPQAEVASAFEQAIRALPGAECTEENCLALVQESLQVNRVFSLQLLQDADSQLTQLSLSLIQGKQRIVKNEHCLNCQLPTLLQSVETVADKLLKDLPDAPKPEAGNPELRVNPETLELAKGATAAVSVSVQGPLTGAVTVSLSASESGLLSLEPETLTFTPEVAEVPQTVQVTAVADSGWSASRTLALTLTVTQSEDVNYGFLAPTSLPVTLQAQEPLVAVVPLPEPLPAPPPDPPPEPSPSEASSGWVWHAVTLGVTGFSMLQAKGAADSYNALESENQELAQRYATSPDPALKSQYESNQASMNSLKATYQTWDLVTYVGLGVEAYLLLADPFAEPASPEPESLLSWVPQPGGFRVQWVHSF